MRTQQTQERLIFFNYPHQDEIFTQHTLAIAAVFDGMRASLVYLHMLKHIHTHSMQDPLCKGQKTAIAHPASSRSVDLSARNS